MSASTYYDFYRIMALYQEAGRPWLWASDELAEVVQDGLRVRLTRLGA